MDPPRMLHGISPNKRSSLSFNKPLCRGMPRVNGSFRWRQLSSLVFPVKFIFDAKQGIPDLRKQGIGVR